MYLEFEAIGLKFVAEVKATPYIHAVTHLAPEHCSPDEGGEIEEWISLDVLIDDGIKPLGPKSLDALFLLDSSAAQEIEQAAYDALASYQAEPDYPDDYYDFEIGV